MDTRDFDQRLLELKEAGFDSEADAAAKLQDKLITARAIAINIYGQTDWRAYVLPIYEALIYDT